MPVTYHYDADSKMVMTTASGAITTGEFLEYLQDVTENSEIEAGFIEVVDFESTYDLTIKYTETQMFKRVWMSYMEKGCKATIIFAPSDVCFGISRMVQGVVGSVENFEPGSFHVVRTKEQLKLALEKFKK